MSCPNHAEVGLTRICGRCGGGFFGDCLVVLRGVSYCAGCKFEHLRDLLSGTPRGLPELASVGRRFVALWIDGLVTSCALLPLMLGGLLSAGLAGTAAQWGQGVVGVLVGLAVFPLSLGLPLVYEGVMLQARGQTLGKMALGLKVVTPEGANISTGQAWGRTAVRVAASSICALVDYLPALFTQERTCVHDLVAKTRVVRLPG